MFGWFKKKEVVEEIVSTPKELTIYAVADGTVIPIEEVKDIVFSQKMMGDGFAVVPNNGVIGSPVDGEIVNVFPTKHAVGFNASGVEVLLHMGIDTVVLNGGPFETQVSEAQRVDANTVVSHVDLAALAAEEKDNAMIVVFTNFNDTVASYELNVGPVTRGQVIGKLVLK